MNSGNTPRRKGQRGELEFRKLLEETGLRVIATGAMQRGKAPMADLLVTSPWGIAEACIEVKHTKAWRMSEYLDQMDRQTRAGSVGALALRKPGDPRWFIGCWWDQFHELAHVLRGAPDL